MKIMTVVGARPQMVKVAAVSRILSEESDVTELLIHTGQHYDRQMSGVFFEELGLPTPFANLGVQEKTHATMVASMLRRLEPIVQAQRPDVMLLYGDTNSTLAGALVAIKERVPIAHVEAGVRTGSWALPEESNRVITDRLARWAFCATQLNFDALVAEGLKEVSHLVGDVMYDAALLAREYAQTHGTLLDQIGLSKGRYVLATCHRAETTDNADELAAILAALKLVAGEIPVVLPLHPRTRRRVEQFGLEPLLADVRLTEPLGFIDMMALEANAVAIVTDSGGVQKEAFFHGIPCVIAYPVASWPEVVALGHNVVAGTSTERIVECTRQAIKMGRFQPPVGVFGDGHAAEKIVNILLTGSGN